MIKSISLDITQPMQFSSVIEMNKLTLFTGYNDVGKSFIMINLFCLGMIALIPEQRGPAAQFIYDSSFTDQNITGKISIKTDGGSLQVEFNAGKVLSVIETGELGLKEPITYMSSDMRTFDAIKMYLGYRKTAAYLSEELMIGELVKTFKLYDILYIEKLIKKCPITTTDQFKQTLLNYDIKEVITEFGVDLEKGDFYVLIPEKKFMTTYGKGHQSLINMFIANS